MSNLTDEDYAIERLEFPHFVSGVLSKVEPRKLRMLASYNDMPVESILRNAYRASKTPEDVMHDTNHFWQHKVN